jgi:hypothetical protein
VPGIARVASMWELATWPRYEESGFDIAARALGLRVLPIGVPSVDAKHRLPWVAQDRDYPVAGALMSYGTDWYDLFRRSALSTNTAFARSRTAVSNAPGNTHAAHVAELAIYVDRILKGAKPADLPVEQPTKFEFVIQPPDRESPRPHDPALGARASGRGDGVGVGGWHAPVRV